MPMTGAGESLSRILARRMAATSLGVLVLLIIAYSVQDFSDYQRLQKATLTANAVAIASALSSGKDPAILSLYRDHPQAYGFLVFDHRTLAKRHLLASANARMLSAVPSPPPRAADTDDPDVPPSPTIGSTKLSEGFSLSPVNPLHRSEKQTIALLTYRVALGDRHYWVQTYMIGDPAFAVGGVIFDDLVMHILIPALFIIPALTLAIFLTTRAVLHPLRILSDSAKREGIAVARGQALGTVPEGGMVREFIEMASTINAILTKLDHTLQSQRQFTSDIAHELRTPLAVMLLEISHLPKGTVRERIKNDLVALGELVNQLLRFAQAEDVMASASAEVDIIAVTRKVVEGAVPEALANQQLIELNGTTDPLTVTGNASLIEIAIRNLVGNALKYSPPRTTVTVAIDPGPAVIVEDCGPGIPPEHRDQMFERFWRMDHPSGNGAGVGLALVRRIAQLHNGSVRVENRPGGGTRMILSFAHSAFEQ